MTFVLTLTVLCHAEVVQVVQKRQIRVELIHNPLPTIVYPGNDPVGSVYNDPLENITQSDKKGFQNSNLIVILETVI